MRKANVSSPRCRAVVSGCWSVKSKLTTARRASSVRVTPCVVASELQSLNTLLDARNAMVRAALRFALVASFHFNSFATSAAAIRTRTPVDWANKFRGVGSAASAAGSRLFGRELERIFASPSDRAIPRAVRVALAGAG